MPPGVDPTLLDVTLSDRYQESQGRVLMSGVQAVVRLALDQRRMDLDAGLNTGGFISGYPGSPLAGLDLELTRRSELLDGLGIVHRPGLNEELAATAVAGSQLAMGQPDHTKDGVFAIWYAKAPGLDRASDALRHGNLMGTSRHGGVLVCVGDDPQAKSSSVPSTSEPTLYALAMPILTPADPQEILELGLHGFAMSRASGLWVGLRIPATVADTTQSVELGGRARPILPSVEFDGAPFTHQVSAQLLGAKLIELETSLYGPRLEVARRYAIANRLNRVTARTDGDWLGIVAAGSAYLEVLQALARIGLSHADLGRVGVRLLKVSMPYPLDEDLVREFASGLEEIVVVEDKRPFLENLVKNALYGVEGAPRIVGKHDEVGRAFVPLTGEVDASALAPLLAGRILLHADVEAVRRWQSRALPPAIGPLPIVRGAYFCSGCPHNTSVKVPTGAYVGSGSGCHGLAIQMDPRQVGTVVGRFQMGGEGAMWNGMSPFVSSEHFFQNIGDGTLAHSGSLAIRAAVASNVNITYKLLVNSTVAMTGGQPIAGGHSVADLARQLMAEGVKRIIVTTDDVRLERSRGLPAHVEVWPRSRILEAQEILAAVRGVTVLLHDQECAAELRRKRKRALVAVPRERVHVNTRLCEGCGDCGAKSNCLSVRPLETPFGRKTRIHQESCNLDFTCLEGNCPALITVRPAERGARRRAPARLDLTRLVAPSPHFSREHFTMRLTGIGGTGVLTVAQIIAMAAHLEGLHVRELDQTGIAQKGGTVVSDLRVSANSLTTTSRLGDEECDLYLGCDLLAAATSQHLAVAQADRTIAIVSTSKVPIGRQVADPEILGPSVAVMKQRIESRSRPTNNVWLDAQRLAHEQLGSDVYANILLLGAAHQSGALPLSATAIERAIELNGIDVDSNLLAFRTGRLLDIEERHPDGPEAVMGSPNAQPARSASNAVQSVDATRDLDFDSLRRTRMDDLAAYHDGKYARRYADVLKRAHDAEAKLGITDGPFSVATAIELHHLMAYKDEYEVARLHLDHSARSEIEHEFGVGARVTYHLIPPVLHAVGLQRKLRMRSSAQLTFHLLRRTRRLRGTMLDPFGRSHYRRQERTVRDDYVAMIDRLSAELTIASHTRSVELAELPAMIRGFGEVKERSIEKYLERLHSLLNTVGSDA